MKNRFIVIYTIFAATVFVFSISFFGYNLFREYSTNLEKSEKKFTELVNDIRTLSFSQETNNSNYIQGIKKSVGDAGNYSYIQVRRNNETVVLYPSGKSKEETLSKLVKSFSTNLTVNKQSVNIDCNIYLIRPDSIFYYARISFLMILIITIITIIMIIYLSIAENSSDVISLEEESSESEELESNSETESVSEIEVATEEEIASESERPEDNSQTDNEEKVELVEEEKDAFEEAEQRTAEASADSEGQSEEDEEQLEKPNSEVTPEEVKAILAGPLTDEQAAAAEAAKLPVDDIKPAPIAEAIASDPNEPAGLFDPETGIGWESYLITRLNNEIDRATASEIDLSLFIIKLDSIEKSSEEFKNVCNYLAIQFQFKDLLFEYKNDCIVAIKISMNVDEALNLATKLYSDIRNIVNNKNIRIGISSRSIRMLTGDRLILEAEQAIEHSDETSPVIAFRVDSEKYRQLMEDNR